MLCAFSFQLTKAQTFAEWFSQKKTQLKYLTDQIAALEQYGAYVKQGYAISQNGLGSIGGWLKSEFDLHDNYYRSLRTVNPDIRNNPKADSIVAMAQLIPGQFDQLNQLVPDAGTLKYIGSVRAAVLAAADNDLAALQVVLSGQAAMTDAERLRRLDAIEDGMRDHLVFTRSFCAQVRVLANQRTLELQSIQTLQIYEKP